LIFGILKSSLVTTLRVAEKFEKSHLESAEVAPLIDAASHFYIEGYFLTHGVESAKYLSSKASAAGKASFCPTYNLSCNLIKYDLI